MCSLHQGVHPERLVMAELSTMSLIHKPPLVVRTLLSQSLCKKLSRSLLHHVDAGKTTNP